MWSVPTVMNACSEVWAPPLGTRSITVASVSATNRSSWRLMKSEKRLR